MNENKDRILQADARPNVLIIAGYDQSGGAGVLADVKTMEAHGVYAYAVVTGMTFQNERVISKIQWLSLEDIFEQIDRCFESARFDWVKIGIGRSMEMIRRIIGYVKQLNPAVHIVLDPVIKASSGKDFWEEADPKGFESLVAEAWLITPNWEEIGWLCSEEDIRGYCKLLSLSAGCHIYLKGGHNPERPGTDHIFSREEEWVLEPNAAPAGVSPKHGSGCVLASSLTANLALGYPFPVACERSKRYIEDFLTSNKTLLGWHSSVRI